MKKLLALLLACLFVLPLFTSCAGDGGKKEKSPEKQVLENVYVSSEYTLPENVRGNQLVKSGDNVFLMGYFEEEKKDEEGNTYYESCNSIYKNDSNFSRWQEVMTFNRSNEWSEEATEARDSYPTFIRSDGQGGFVVLIHEWYENWSDPENYIYEQNWKVQCVNGEGETTSEVELDIDTGEEYFYVSNLAVLENGNYLVFSDMSTYIMGADGKLIKESSVNKNVTSVSRWIDGKYAVTYYNDNWDICFGFYDPELDKLEEVGPFESYRGAMSPVTTDDGKLYIINDIGLIEYDPMTLEEKGVEINWFNSDINPNFVYSLMSIDGEFYNIDNSDWEKPVLTKLTPCDDVIEKYVINLACLYLDYNMTESILEFNRSNEEYRILVTTYYEYDKDTGEDLGVKKLENEIIKGNIPDIISLQGLDFKNYASKGILTDLNPLIEADGEISKDDFLDTVLSASTVDGKLYSIITNFAVQSLMGKTSVVGDRKAWTWRELNETLAKYPDAVAFTQMERETLLRNILSVTLYDFVDYSTGEPKFDSEEFQEVLKFCKPYPETINWDAFYEDYDWEVEQTMYRENGILLMDRYFSSPWDFMYNNNPFEEEVTMIGYPTSGDCGSVLEVQGEWGISENCYFKEQAFDFLKKIVYEDEVHGFSVVRERIDKSFEEAVEQSKEQFPVPEEGVVEVPEVDDAVIEEEVSSDFVTKDVIYPNGSEMVFDEETALKYKEFVTGVSRRRAPRQHELINIVVEESAGYFAGDKSIEETCKIIQSRAFLFVSENM